MTAKADYKHLLKQVSAACAFGAPNSEVTQEIVSSLNGLINQADVGERFVAHVDVIWNALFPDDISGWEYGAQAERLILEKIAELKGIPQDDA